MRIIYNIRLWAVLTLVFMSLSLSAKSDEEQKARFTYDVDFEMNFATGSSTKAASPRQ